MPHSLPAGMLPAEKEQQACEQTCQESTTSTRLKLQNTMALAHYAMTLKPVRNADRHEIRRDYINDTGSAPVCRASFICGSYSLAVNLAHVYTLALATQCFLGTCPAAISNAFIPVQLLHVGISMHMQILPLTVSKVQQKQVHADVAKQHQHTLRKVPELWVGCLQSVLRSQSLPRPPGQTHAAAAPP